MGLRDPEEPMPKDLGHHPQHRCLFRGDPDLDITEPFFQGSGENRPENLFHAAQIRIQETGNR